MLSLRFSTLSLLSFLTVSALVVLPGLASPDACFAQDAAVQEQPAAEAPAKLFPDPGLEAAVRAEVFAKRYNAEPLTIDDVKNISRVVGVKKGIKSLEGLQHCAALMLVDLSENEIGDLSPMAGLKRLQSVTLSKNQITDLKPLEELTAVQLLDISDNKVTQLDAVTKMSNLRSLWLADNQVTSLAPIASLTKIWSLDVAGNGLSDISPAGQLKWLTNLDLDRNKIESLDALRPLKELDLLLVRENQIKDLKTLVEMCQEDAAGEKRFAPYLRLYLKGNPLSEEAQGPQLDQLRQIGVRISME